MASTARATRLRCMLAVCRIDVVGSLHRAAPAISRQRSWPRRRDPGHERSAAYRSSHGDGVRVQPEARPVSEGRYAVTDHNGHTHRAHALELPREPGEPGE